MSGNVIVWPSATEFRSISEEFADMGFPNAIGCIDGTHIRIYAPLDDAVSYLNRKKYYSIQVQAVCDNTKKIRDVFIGYPGSVHDARVFRTSPLGQNLSEKCRDYVLLGDSAYPCLRNLLTPYKDNGNLTNVKKKYNKKLSHCRVFIEHTIGLLTQRFRQLYHLKSRNIDRH
ncbi:putative nuclease HARBI1 isoform X2 [Coccinella septempunctata]|nr:putative nuclease HARBI1 isoform X2 [Coccinella septempunctata]